MLCASPRHEHEILRRRDSTDLKVNPSRVVKRATDAHRPVLLTRRGRGVAVVQSVNDYESAEEERAFMRALLSEMVIRRITQ